MASQAAAGARTDTIRGYIAHALETRAAELETDGDKEDRVTRALG